MIGRVNTGGGGAGGTLTVNAPAGATVTVSTDVATSSGAQLFDINDVFRLNNCNIISDDIIEVYCDNTGSTSPNYANFFTKKSDILIPSKEYLIIAEVFECSGIVSIYPTSAANDRSAGQFKTEKNVGKATGVYVYKAVTKDSFDGCVTMCRGFVEIAKGSIGRAKIRISVIDDLSVTADTFVYRPFTGETNLRKYSKTKVAGADGVVVFKGLKSGQWTLTITDGTQTASKTVEIVADYVTSITFFAATINVTYPSGSTCTATDGTTTFTAPDTSGTWECIVPNAGTWTVSCTNGTESDTETVSITSDGQTTSVTLLYELYLFQEGNGFLVPYVRKPDTNGGNITINITNSYIEFHYYNVTGAWMTVGTKNEVDFANFKKLNFDILASEHYSNYGGTMAVGVTPEQTKLVTDGQPVFSAKVNPTVDGVRRTVSLDVSGISKGYVTIYGILRAKIYNIWAE